MLCSLFLVQTMSVVLLIVFNVITLYSLIWQNVTKQTLQFLKHRFIKYFNTRENYQPTH